MPIILSVRLRGFCDLSTLNSLCVWGSLLGVVTISVCAGGIVLCYISVLWTPFFVFIILSASLSPKGELNKTTTVTLVHWYVAR